MSIHQATPLRLFNESWTQDFEIPRGATAQLVEGDPHVILTQEAWIERALFSIRVNYGSPLGSGDIIQVSLSQEIEPGVWQAVIAAPKEELSAAASSDVIRQYYAVLSPEQGQPGASSASDRASAHYPTLIEPTFARTSGARGEINVQPIVGRLRCSVRSTIAGTGNHSMSARTTLQGLAYGQ